jgi:hypothetical protein
MPPSTNNRPFTSTAADPQRAARGHGAFSEIRPSNQKKACISLEGKYGIEARGIELVENYHAL